MNLVELTYDLESFEKSFFTDFAQSGLLGCLTAFNMAFG